MTRLSVLALTAALAAGPGFADTQATDGAMKDETTMGEARLIRSRDITGGEIYSVGTEVDDATWSTWEATEIGDDWNNIGEIEDLVLDENGQMIGIVAEIGGFLDIGDKHVMISIDEAKLTAVDDTTFVYVTRKTEEQLEEMDSVDEGFWN